MFWGKVLERDLLGETREEDKIRSREQLDEYLRSEIEKQGEHVVINGCYLTDSIDDLSGLFYEIADGVKSLELSYWTIPDNVKNMSYMFYKCSSLESLELSLWNTTNVKDMFSMFYGCTNLKSLDLTSFDTSNVKHMSLMFANCEKLKSLNLSGWNTSNVKDMIGIFDSCPALYKVVDNQIIKKIKYRVVISPGILEIISYIYGRQLK